MAGKVYKGLKGIIIQNSTLAGGKAGKLASWNKSFLSHTSVIFVARGLADPLPCHLQSMGKPPAHTFSGKNSTLGRLITIILVNNKSS